MSDSQLDEAEASVRAAEGPGHRLRQARLAQGLEIARVANQLHLSEAVIEALEREDFARIPPVFVKGYIANYGRLLGLPADPLLAAHARLQPELEGSWEPGPRSKRMPKRLGSRNRVGYLLSGLILVGILAAGGYWVKTRLQSGEDLWPMPGAAVDAVEEPSDELPPSLQAFLEETSEPEPVAAEPPPAEPVASEPGRAEDKPVPIVAQPAPPRLVQTEAAAAEPPAAEAADAGTEAAGPPKVVLELLGSCWVDIRDANGKNKIIGELTKGARRTLQGEPPFSVVLGNSRAVRILIDGVPYDIGQHARGNVARFKLDPLPAAPEG
jgi:cytoskeleton protein RodZ